MVAGKKVTKSNKSQNPIVTEYDTPCNHMKIKTQKFLNLDPCLFYLLTLDKFQRL